MEESVEDMLKLLLWCVLFLLCWPLAVMALVLYPVVWLLLLPFRMVGIAVEGVLSLLWAMFTLPARLLGTGPRQRYPQRRMGYLN